jgi:hypothetical protein
MDRCRTHLFVTDGDPGVTEWDFFVSYQQTDRTWAEWSAWQLETAGHSVLLQLWDFVPAPTGSSSCKMARAAASVIVVLSPSYTGSVFGAAEWKAIWAHDPGGAQRRVIPIRVADCERPGPARGNRRHRPGRLSRAHGTPAPPKCHPAVTG